ncbi:guanylate-binding protein 1-like [Scleropages formosus]|uniref:guanylate-binding protein 1-like n=1 Tax=Scleropages formosus TaxID=113540 RepID=UPI0010FAA258|nr:guanylate-binding protein 1-like [Scleropages formosus]
MAHPVCLIENIEENKVKINQEALAILSSISQPVVVVSIVGKYRTGKSYLMNRLAGKRTGFSLGSTVQSNTKGIWMWCVPHPRREGQTLVLLDTEGLGDVEKDDLRYDSYVFTLAILLSSTLVYNTKGTIDNEELLRLQYMTELTKLIHVRSTTEDKNKASSEFIRFFPSFVWVVRDFTLELEIDGKEVTTDRYLENALKLKQGNSEEIRQSNILRECIRNYFPSRKCFVFYQPTNRNHHNLEKLNDTDLDPDFVKQTNEFCSYIFDSSKEKTIPGGVRVNGSMLGQLAVMYVEAIHSGQVPCLENAVDVLAQRENASLADKSYDLYQNLLGEQVVLPTETQQEFSSVHEECMKKALKLFMEHSFKDEDQRYQNFLMTCIQKEYERKCQENEQLSYKHCTDLLEKLWGNIDHKSYMRPGGYLDYRATVDSIIKKYKATPQKGLKAEEALQTFLKQKEDMESCILKADHSLTEQQKKLEEEKAHAEVEKFKAEVAKKKEEALNQRIKDIEKAYKENEQQLVEKMEKERNTMIEENKRILEKRLQEEKTLTEEGFNQKAKVISAIIEELQEEQMKLFFSENYGPELKDPSFSFAKISRINEQKEN